MAPARMHGHMIGAAQLQQLCLWTTVLSAIGGCTGRAPDTPHNRRMSIVSTSTANRFGIGIYDDTSAPPLSVQLPEASRLVGEGGHVLLYFNLLFATDGDPLSCEDGCRPVAWQTDAVNQAYSLGLSPVVRLGQWSRHIRDFADDAATVGGRQGHRNFTTLATQYKRFVSALPLPPDGSPLLIQLLNEPNVCGEWQCLEGPGSFLPAAETAAEVASCLRDLVAALRPLPRLWLAVAPIAQVGFSRCECSAPFTPTVPQNATDLSFVNDMLTLVPDLYENVDFLCVHAYPNDWRQGFDTPSGRAGITSYQPLRDLVARHRKQRAHRALQQVGSGGDGGAGKIGGASRVDVPSVMAQPLPVVVGETGWQGPNQTLKAESIVQALTEVYFADPSIVAVLPFLLANSGQYAAMWPWTLWPENASEPTTRYAEWLATKALRCKQGVGGSAGCPTSQTSPSVTVASRDDVDITAELVTVDVWSDYYANGLPGSDNAKACWLGSPPIPVADAICKSSRVDAAGQIEVLHQFGDGRPHNRDYIPPVSSSRYPNIGPVTNYDVQAGWRCFSDVGHTCTERSSSPPQAVPPHPQVRRVNGTHVPLGMSQFVTPGSSLTEPYTMSTLGSWQQFEIRKISPDNCTESGPIGTVWHRVWLGVADVFDFGGDIGVQRDVLVLDEEEWSVPTATVSPPSTLTGGMRLERYLYPKGAWGRSAQLGAENAACRASPLSPIACNGRYELQGGVVYWNSVRNGTVQYPTICPLGGTTIVGH